MDKTIAVLRLSDVVHKRHVIAINQGTGAPVLVFPRLVGRRADESWVLVSQVVTPQPGGGAGMSEWRRDEIDPSLDFETEARMDLSKNRHFGRIPASLTADVAFARAQSE